MTSRTFDHVTSSTFKQTSEPFEGLYGSGESYGKVGTDVIALGNFSIPSYAFAVLSEETGAIPNFLVDGVVGLAFVGMRKIEGHPTTLESLLAANPDMNAVFAFHLTKDSDPAPSEFHIGGIDLSVCGDDPRVTYFPVVNLPIEARLTYWTIILNDFYMIPSTSSIERTRSRQSTLRQSAKTSASPQTNFCHPYCFVIVDSGTSFTYAPAQHFHAIMNQITDGLKCDLESFQCEDVSYDAFPTLSFSFGKGQNTGDNSFHLKPENYVVCKDFICDIQLRNHGELGDGLYWWVLGENFLQAYYTIFDFKQMRVGLTQLIDAILQNLIQYNEQSTTHTQCRNK
uniref:Peptidase A1 domain-containing protein n=1 Tax=Globisporangium ultimum (strain ATCC 200006 / CBS 805.95 / DAOM BR144) TaxID=431595 RepID=K3XBE6_GLOUD